MGGGGGGGGGNKNVIVFTEYCLALPDRSVSVFCLDSSCGQSTASERCMNWPSRCFAPESLHFSSR